MCTAVHVCTYEHTLSHYNSLHSLEHTLQVAASHCKSLQHTSTFWVSSTHCNTHRSTHCNTHCKATHKYVLGIEHTLQHTLQHTPQHTLPCNTQVRFGYRAHTATHTATYTTAHTATHSALQHISTFWVSSRTACFAAKASWTCIISCCSCALRCSSS